jgi:hypothetical protein
MVRRLVRSDPAGEPLKAGTSHHVGRGEERPAWTPGPETPFTPDFIKRTAARRHALLPGYLFFGGCNQAAHLCFDSNTMCCFKSRSDLKMVGGDGLEPPTLSV